MGYENELKTRNANPVVTLDLIRSVHAAVAASREEFHKILGSDPIVEVDNSGKRFTIATYGGGEYQLIGCFYLEQLPGCCGVAVFYHASVTTKFTRRGLGRLFLNVRERAAILAGYTIAQATVLASNKTELALLTDAGWSNLATFKNKRTTNSVVVLLKKLA